LSDHHTTDAFAYAIGPDPHFSDEMARALHRQREEMLARLLADVFSAEQLRAFVQPQRVNTPNPERIKAVARCRDLKRLRDGTTYEGERSNAQAAMARLMTKHGITEREI